MGNAANAAGLVALYVIIILFRQILEPKILGVGMGISPLLALIAIYAGLKLFGFWGMILLPPLVIITKNSITAILQLPKEDIT